jgi:hypothetical protein
MAASDHLNAEQLQLFVAPRDENYTKRLYANLNSMGFPSPKHALLTAAIKSEREFKKWAEEYDKTHELKLF